LALFSCLFFLFFSFLLCFLLWPIIAEAQLRESSTEQPAAAAEQFHTTEEEQAYRSTRRDSNHSITPSINSYQHAEAIQGGTFSWYGALLGEGKASMMRN
jgi:hypothetical protein